MRIKPHYIYWLWAIASGMILGMLGMIYLAPIAWLFPPIMFGFHIVTGKDSEAEQ